MLTDENKLLTFLLERKSKYWDISFLRGNVAFKYSWYFNFWVSFHFRRRLCYLGCSMWLVAIIVEGDAVLTVLQLVLGYPLTVSVPSLCCQTGYFGCLITKINLQPLIDIIGASWPWSCFTWRFLKVQSALDGGMISVKLWRSTDLCVRDCTAFHAQSFSTFCKGTHHVEY